MSLSPSKSRYDSLDIWRGVACLAVIVGHVAGLDRRFAGPASIAAVIPWLGFGVQLFFVISGYCIASACDSARRKGRSFAWFMQRRFHRIYPPYWACLVIVTVATGMGLSGIGLGRAMSMNVGHWLGNLTLTEQWLPRLAGKPPAFFLLAAWTLCYEEQFYLVCGMAIGLSRRRFFPAMCLITALVVPTTVLHWSGSVNLGGFFFDGYWLQFASGVLVYYCRNYAGSRTRRYSIALLIAATVATVWLRLTLPPLTINDFPRSVFLDGTAMAFAFAAFLLSASRYDGAIAGAAVLRPIRACGIMCYSLYLIHIPAIYAVRAALTRLGLGGSRSSIGLGEAAATVACSVVAGWCFFRLVESRFLNPPSAAADPAQELQP